MKQEEKERKKSNFERLRKVFNEKSGEEGFFKGEIPGSDEFWFEVEHLPKKEQLKLLKEVNYPSVSEKTDFGSQVLFQQIKGIVESVEKQGDQRITGNKQRTVFTSRAEREKGFGVGL